MKSSNSKSFSERSRAWCKNLLERYEDVQPKLDAGIDETLQAFVDQHEKKIGADPKYDLNFAIEQIRKAIEKVKEPIRVAAYTWVKSKSPLEFSSRSACGLSDQRGFPALFLCTNIV